jgi:hypothetical protein
MLPQPSEQGNYRVYHKIAAAALKVNAVAYRVYIIAQSRAAATQGLNTFTVAELRPYCPLTLSDRQLRLGLKAAREEGWLTQHGHTYRMISRAKLMGVLGVMRPGRAVLIPADQIADLTHFKALLYSAWFEGRQRRDPSRDVLEATFGISRQTQYEYEERADIQVQPRIVVMEPPAAIADYEDIESAHTIRLWAVEIDHKHQVTAQYRLMDNNNHWTGDEVADGDLMAYQLSNRYEPTQTELAASGRGKWLRADIPALMDREDSRPRQPQRPKVFDSDYQAVKWQSKRFNRERVVYAEKVLFEPTHRYRRVKLAGVSVLTLVHSYRHAVMIPALVAHQARNKQ